MPKKDSEKDSERPHYYSQFWLDIAAGRKTIGAPRANDEIDVIEPELEEPIPLRRSARSGASNSSHRYEAAIVHPEVEPIEEVEEEEFEEEPADELDMAEDEVDEADIPNIVVEETAPELSLADAVMAAEDEAPVEEEEEEEKEPEEEDFYEEEEEEEPEEGWPGRGRKKPKGRQTRLPAKKVKRERRAPGF